MPLFRAEHAAKRRLFRPVLLHDLSQTLYLPFDKDDGSYARDRSGYNNHGTIYGATRVSGKIGDALSFDGVDDYVEVPNFTVTEPSKLTLAAWVYANEFKSYAQLICKHIDVDNRLWFGQIYVDAKGGYYHIGYNIGGEGWAFTRTDYLEINRWYHVVGPIDTRLMKIYVNGTFIRQGEHPATDFDWNALINPINIGYPYWINGIIDEPRIYNRVLSQAEIARLMNMRGL